MGAVGRNAFDWREDCQIVEPLRIWPSDQSESCTLHGRKDGRGTEPLRLRAEQKLWDRCSVTIGKNNSDKLLFPIPAAAESRYRARVLPLLNPDSQPPHATSESGKNYA